MVGYLELPDGSQIEARDGLIIGRVAQCDITLDDAKASRKHAKLIVERGVVEVQDLGSSNGTTLNGKTVDRRMVRSGDVIGVGTTEIRFVEGAMPSAAAAAEPTSTAAPNVDENLLGDDLFDDDFDFVDAPVAPPQIDAPAKAAVPPPPQPAPAPAAAPKPPAAPKPAPKPAPKASTAKSAVSPKVTAAKAADEKRADHGVLKFSERRKGGLFGDDIGQAGGQARLLMFLGGVVIAIAAGYAVMQLVSS